jgi:hypothetical protein
VAEFVDIGGFYRDYQFEGGWFGIHPF